MFQAAVIIPHYNDTTRLARCLAALMPGLPSVVEVVVVDNGSAPEARGPLQAICAAYPGLRLVSEPQPGAACARNCGVAATTAPRLFFLDCDCLPDPDWLATALRVADQADLVGGAVRVFDETPPPRSAAQAFETVFAFDNRAYVEKKGFSGTGNLLTRRDVFADVGPFVPGLSEDVDWCRRARAKGYRLIHAPDLRVGHPSRNDWPALRRKWRRLTEEAFGLHGQGGAARLLWALRAALMPVSIAAHLPRILRDGRLSGPGERLAATGMLIRLRLIRAVWMLRQAAGLKI